jgi:pilus assembly protein CpaF
MSGLFQKYAKASAAPPRKPAADVMPAVQPSTVAERAAPVEMPAPEPQIEAQGSHSPEYLNLKVNLHQQLLGLINLSALDKLSPEEVRRDISEIVRDVLIRDKIPLNQSEQSRLTNDILDEVLGLGPLEPLLKDPSITDILINGASTVFVERHGRMQPSAVKFKDERHLLRIINKIVSTVGRRIDESSPLVDARLLDGSRVNAVVSPIAIDGAIVSIRKFSKVPFKIETLVEKSAMAPEMAEFLGAAVLSRVSVLISGGTGSGKTTILNALSRFIENTERIITIEDAAELQLQQSHVVRMETRPANIEGKGEISSRDLVKNALRMRPDRIIIGEVRGGEAFDMLQAMNTGHEGSMATVHANTPRDAIGRLEQMISMAGLDLPIRGVRQQIASAINLVVQMQRLSDGRRRMVSVQEITGMEGDIISMQEIFRFHRTGMGDAGQVLGEYRATGIRPKFVTELGIKGITLSPDMFRPERVLGQ